MRLVGDGIIFATLRTIYRGAREAHRGLARVAARRAGATVADNVVITGRAIFDLRRGSAVTLHSGVVLNAVVAKNSLEARGPVIIKTLSETARVVVGPESGMTSSTVSAITSVSIGARVLIGAGCVITDSDHHVVHPPTGLRRRHLGLPEASPQHAVVIEDDVFIGARSIVLKGVTIGRGSVVGAGSVVARDIPPHSIAAGNPCVVVGAVRE